MKRAGKKKRMIRFNSAYSEVRYFSVAEGARDYDLCCTVNGSTANQSRAKIITMEKP